MESPASARWPKTIHGELSRDEPTAPRLHHVPQPIANAGMHDSSAARAWQPLRRHPGNARLARSPNTRLSRWRDERQSCFADRAGRHLQQADKDFAHDPPTPMCHHDNTPLVPPAWRAGSFRCQLRQQSTRPAILVESRLVATADLTVGNRWRSLQAVSFRSPCDLATPLIQIPCGSFKTTCRVMIMAHKYTLVYYRSKFKRT